MIILGIDPGTHRIGYGVIEKKQRRLIFKTAGVLKIKTRSGYERFSDIRKEMNRLVKLWKPSIGAVEKLFFEKNRKTGIQVAQVRGIIILSLIENGIKIREYSPNEVKSNLTGYGFANKKAVAKMVKMLLKEPKLDIIDDASDALALAILGSR